jgi:hypothetical protein
MSQYVIPRSSMSVYGPVPRNFSRLCVCRVCLFSRTPRVCVECLHQGHRGQPPYKSNRRAPKGRPTRTPARIPTWTPTPQKTKKTRPVSAPDAVAACRVLLEGIEKDLTPQSIRSEEAARERTWEDKLFAVAGNYVVQRRFLKAKSRPARVVLYLQK